MIELGTFELIYKNGDIHKGDIGSPVRGAHSRVGSRPIHYKLHFNKDIDIRHMTLRLWIHIGKWIEELNQTIDIKYIGPDETKGIKHLIQTPIELVSRKTWLEERLTGLGQVIRRNTVEKLPVPLYWTIEYNEILNELNLHTSVSKPDESVPE